MEIRLNAIREEGLELSGTEPSELLGLDEAPEIGSVGDIDYKLHAQIASDELIVNGSVSAKLELECSRCGVFFSTCCGNSSFLRAYRIETGSDRVDISEGLREAVMLSIPTFAICSDDCSGLCPVCGKNMNKETCECVQPTSDDRWGVLDELDLGN